MRNTPFTDAQLDALFAAGRACLICESAEADTYVPTHNTWTCAACAEEAPMDDDDEDARHA